jgi:hypothetical protein
VVVDRHDPHRTQPAHRSRRSLTHRFTDQPPTQFAVIAGLFAVALVPSIGMAVAPDTVQAIPLRPALSRTLYAVSSHVDTRPAVTACLSALADAAAAWSSPTTPPTSR